MLEDQGKDTTTTSSEAKKELDLILAVKPEPSTDESVIEYSDEGEPQDGSGVLRPEEGTLEKKESKTSIVNTPKIKSVPVPRQSSRARLYQCDQCRRCFSSHLSLQVHFDFQHMGVRKCRQCNIRFPTPSSLEAHLETTHPGTSKILVQKLKTPRSQNKKSGMLRIKNQPAPKKEKTKDKNGVKTRTESAPEKAPISEISYPDENIEDGYEDEEFSEAEKDAESQEEEEVVDTTRDDPDWVAPAALRKSGTEKAKCDPDAFSSSGSSSGSDSEKVGRPKEFKCSSCPKSFSSASHLKAHVSLLHLRQKFRCQECDKQYVSEELLEVHMDWDHRGLRFNKCPECDMPFHQESQLRDHMRVQHHNRDTNSIRESKSKESIAQPVPQHHEGGNSYACKQCSAAFPNRSSLRVHMKVVHKLNKRFQCPHCQKAFRVGFRLSEHVKMMHKGERKYCCRFCNCKFFVKSHLTRHVNTYHINGTAVRCPQCSKVFRQEEDMKAHMLKEHADVSPFFCRHCHSCFLTWEECVKHGKEVHPDQLNESSDFSDLQCRACSSVFDTLGDLRRHENTCTRVSKAITGSVDRFCCNECGMIFVLASALRTHLSSVHEIDPEEDEKIFQDSKGMPCFLCPFCQKTYTELKGLRKHLAQFHMEDAGETDVTPEQLEDMENIGDGLIFECKDCGNVYSSRANLRKHELVTHALEGSGNQHGSLGNYKCDLCDRYYFLLSNLRSHVIAVHNADPSSCSQGNEMQNLPSLQCRMCPRSFTTYSNLRRHLFTVHKAPKGTKVFPRDEDGEKMREKPTREKMEKAQMARKTKQMIEKVQKPKVKEIPGPPPLTCTICGITLGSVDLLVEHTTLVHTVQLRSTERTTVTRQETRYYTCTLCSNVFTNLSMLRRHQAFDHGGTTPPKYTYPRKSVKAMMDTTHDQQISQNAFMYPLEIIELPVDTDPVLDAV